MITNNFLPKATLSKQHEQRQRTTNDTCRRLGFQPKAKRGTMAARTGTAALSRSILSQIQNIKRLRKKQTAQQATRRCSKCLIEKKFVSACASASPRISCRDSRANSPRRPRFLCSPWATTPQPPRPHYDPTLS